MPVITAIARYLVVIGVSAGVGLALTKFGMAIAAGGGAKVAGASTYFGLWIIISLIVSMVLAGLSFFFLGAANADEVSHYEGTAIGNSVNLRPVTQGESSWKWRVGLIWTLMFAAEFFLFK